RARKLVVSREKQNFTAPWGQLVDRISDSPGDFLGRQELGGRGRSARARRSTEMEEAGASPLRLALVQGIVANDRVKQHPSRRRGLPFASPVPKPNKGVLDQVFGRIAVAHHPLGVADEWLPVLIHQSLKRGRVADSNPIEQAAIRSVAV